MNIRDADKILNKYYDKIDIITEKDIARCEKHYKSIPYQIFYFDYSQKWLEENFDLEKYFQELLTYNYYSNPGFLQWNFYVVFLYNSRIPSEEKKVMIEKNEEFARKFVLNYELLDDWLDNKFKIETDESSAISQDLSLSWMNKLKNNDLDCVYSKNISYIQGLNHFIEGKPFKEKEKFENSKQPVTKNKKLTAIKKIILEKYRKFPLRKEFDFGKVNLIFGQNGSGKTSLLEAIEVFLCGKNFRNPENIDTSISIKVLYADKHNFENIDISNTEKYKSRDADWYNNPQRGNNLYIGFNRFNFYNSDAAFSFSNQGSSDELQKAFVDIALGEKVNYIENRLDGYSERFEKEQRKCKNSISEYQDIIDREKYTLKEISDKNKNPEFLFNKFIDEAKNIKWNGDLPQSLNDSYATFEKDYNKVKLYLDKVLENINWLENLTINSLFAEKNKLDKLKINILNRYIKINEQNKKLTEYKERLNYLKEILATINKLKIYRSTGASTKLIGLDEKIKDLTLKELKLKEAIQITEDVDFNVFLKDSEFTIEEFEDKLQKLICEKNTIRLELTNKINKLEKGLTQLEDIIIEIKSNGIKFLAIAPDAQNCPLCNGYYNKGELKSLVECSFNNIEESNVLRDFLVERDKLITEIDEINSQLKTVNYVEKAISKIENSDIRQKYPLYIIREKLSHYREEYLKIKQELRTINILKDDLKSEGFSERELIELKEKLVERGIKFDENEPNYFIRNILKYEKENEDVKNNIYNIDGIIIQENKLIKEMLLKSFNENVSLKNLDIFLHNRIEKTNSSIKLLEDLSDVIIIPDDTSINKIKIMVESIYKLFEKFKEEKAGKDKIDIIVRKCEMAINLYDTKIAQTEKKKERIDKAYSVIKDILTNDSKEKYLQDFLNGNKKEIVRIFNAIHSPKEFDDVDFTDSQISLKRLDSNEPAKLSEISTGQRSALALSVFLCLNNKLHNGPPYIILDDPISFVDDLNLLSFIDYFREISINTDKQIFFATANTNLKFLFSQKFKFLGEEFRTYSLTR